VVIRLNQDLPEELDLPLASGASYWYWLGGRPALDLVNTLRERWRRRVECVVTPADLAHWLVEAQVMTAPAEVPPRVLRHARELREAIDAAVVAVVDGRRVPAEAVSVIDDWLVYAGERPQLMLRDGSPALGERAAADSPRRALGTIALDAATLLGDPDQRRRLRICASETCSARFYDRSPAAGRRWCSMQTCGNVAKARRHRARAVDAGAPS
jgi:predicted RNA-binding Zn ribbon-like protein